MKNKNLKISKIFMITFAFIVFFFLSFTFKIGAASLDLYFPDTVIAKEYDTEGKIIVKDEILVYVDTSSIGKQIGTKYLRVKSVEVTSGGTTATFSRSDEKFSTYVGVASSSESLPGSNNSNGYADLSALSKSAVGIVTLHMAKIMEQVGSNYTNKVTIVINFEDSVLLFGAAVSWDDYEGQINYYKKATLQSSNSVSLSKTNATLANSQFKISDVYLDKETFNLNDLNDTSKDVKLTVQTNYKIVGNMKAYYDGYNYVTLTFNNSNSATVSLRNNSSLLRSGVDETIYNFNSFSLSGAKDRYGSTLWSSIGSNGQSASFILDTKAPTITEAKVVSGGTSKLYDIGEIYTKYSVSENADFTFTLNTIRYKVGSVYKTITVSDQATVVRDTNNPNEFITSQNLSSIGVVTVIGFKATLSDEYGNQTNYTTYNTASLCKNHETVEIIASIQSITYDASRSYFYGDTIDLIVTLASGLRGNHFKHIDVVLSNGVPTSFDTTQETGNVVTLSYQITTNSKLSISYVKGYIPSGSDSEVNTYTSGDLNIALNSSDLISSVTTPYLYYYDDDTINLTLTFSSSASRITSFSSLKLVFEDKTISLATTSTSIYVKQETNSSIVKISYPLDFDNSTTKLKSIDLYRNGSDTEVKVISYNLTNQVIINEYVTLSFEESYKNPDEILIYRGDVSETWGSNYAKISSTPALSFTCTKESYEESCSYTSSSDGIYEVEIESGFIRFSNGKKNSSASFNIIVNTRAPSVEFIEKNVAKYNNVNYYKNQTNVLLYSLIDGYGDNKCLYYNFEGEDATFINACSNEVVMFPLKEGEYTLYYYTSDGINTSALASYNTKFIYKDNFVIDDIEIKVNDTLIDDSIARIEGSYNYINVDYKNAQKLDLLKSFDVIVTAKGTLTASSELDAYTFILEKINLPSVSEDVKVELRLTDKLGNVKTYDLTINIDTINPLFDDIQVVTTRVGTNYNVTISGYDNNQIYVKVNGQRVDLDSNSSFTTSEEQYVIVLIDEAGNMSEKVFTTINPSIELFDISTSNNIEYEINITPFNESHKIDSYKYLVFDYLKEINNDDMKAASANVCTLGRKVNCYVNGSFNETSNVIYQTFNKGYTYILLVKINNILANIKDSNDLPRLDIAPADVTKPVISVLDNDTNPDFISSTSNRTFTFSFNAKDQYLTDTYLYMLVDSTINANTILQPVYFYELYSACYLDDSSNGCGIIGENEYVSSVENKAYTYLGEVVIQTNHNTMRRLINNTIYNLYVLLEDESGNASVYKIRNFKNITTPSNIEYVNDSGMYTTISNGNSVATINTTNVKVTPYNNIEIESVTIDGEIKTCDASNGCNYDLRVGKHVVDVVDVLGNKTSVTIYSATANNPVIEIYYEYNSEYFKVLDNSLSYNTSNVGKVYIKAIGDNLKSVEVVMGSTSKYETGDKIFNDITSDSNTYGMSLSSLMNEHGESSYSSAITITVINVNDAYTTITLNVDNVSPEITSVAPDTQVNLLGNQYTLNYSAGKYNLSFNYQRDITYTYLMNAINLKVDGISFDDIRDNNRFKVSIDDTLFTNYDNPITKGNKVIAINYFDNAGNVADTYTLVVNVSDNEAPVISLNNAITSAELNVSYKLAQVSMSDNHDEYSDLTLVTKIGSDLINYTEWVFTSVGEFNVVYRVSDTSGNYKEITQTIIVKDTVAPELKEGTITHYETSLKEKLEIALPIFIDSDSSNSEYLPYQIILLDPNSNLMDSTSATYPLVIEGNVMKLEFVDGLKTGTYTIAFIAKDKYNNATEEYFTILVKDNIAPTFNVAINGKNVENNSTYSYPLHTEINISVSAYDNSDGNLSSLVETILTLNGNTVNRIDSSVNGTYIAIFKVKDSSNNIGEFKVTIIVNKDTTLPVINKVMLNDIELIEGIRNKINGTNIVVSIDAYDEFGDINCIAIINDVYSMENNSSISLEGGLSGEVYVVKVIVSDASGNETVKYYDIIIDNVAPMITGATQSSVNHNKVTLEFYDDNLEVVNVYRNNNGYDSINYNLSGYELTNDGVYEIVAKDTHGNETRLSFVIAMEKVFNVLDSNGASSVHSYDYSALIEAVIEDNNLTFILSHKGDIDNNDQVYILLSHPNSNYKYVVYSMNGETYLLKESITLENFQMPGIETSELLEKLENKSYGYIMVVKGTAADTEQTEENNVFLDVLKTIGSIVFFVGLAASLLFLFIKLRRRIRAA